MPFTPFHLGPGLLFGMLAYRRLDLPTLLLASVAVDARATLVFFGVLGGPLHGPLHTLIGSTAVGLVVAGGWYLLRPHLDTLLELFWVKQPRSAPSIVAAALIGVWVAVLLDAVLYPEMRPLAPLSDLNPVYGLTTPLNVYAGCLLAGVVGLGLYLLHLVREM